MNPKLVRATLVIGILILAGAGCQTRTAGTSTMPTIPGLPSVAVTSPCEHPYYPLKPGYEIAYQTKWGTNVSNYSEKVTAGGSDSVQLHLAFDGGTTSDQTIQCRDGKLQVMGYVDVASATQSKRANVTTKSVEGDFLPKDLRVGSEWTNKFEIEMDMSQIAAGGLNKVEGTITTQRKVLGEEEVTVPAGTFKALKIQAETAIDTHLPGVANGVTASIPKLVTTEWWVKGKGMVKSVMSMGAGQGDNTSEATRIVVP